MIKKLNNINLAFILFLNIIISNNLFANTLKSEIIYKINDEIITNLDIENEKNFLIFLNPNLVNLSEDQIDEIVRRSVLNRKIKEIELKKFYDLDKNEITDSYINNYLNSSEYKNKNDLIQNLARVNLEFQYLEKNFLIDNLWREYIFKKFNTQIKIDENKLKVQIKNFETEIEELNLSEILFKEETGTKFEDLVKKIYSEIDNAGFEAAASIYSISDSKNYGGKLGWIKSSQISQDIFSIIKNLNGISKPIKTNNDYLIIKVNERRKIKEEINLEQELNRLVNLEKNKELNKLGFIYFNKIKKRIFINEK